MKQKLVVIGAGMASGRALEHLFEMAPGTFDVTLFGAEPRGNYNRIMLSPVLSGEKTYEEIVTHDADWYVEHGVNCRFGETVTRIDRKNKTVHTQDGETAYDKLLVATGSAPFIIPVAGRDLPGVRAFRDLDDVNAMVEAAGKPGAQAVVIGGGLLGLEAAAGLHAQGMKVTVLHLMDHLLERQLDPAAGHLLKKELEGRGLKVHCKAQTKAILGEDHAEAVLLEDGTVYPADMVIMAAGIRPETRIAVDAGLHVERGVVVDDAMLTSDPDILAIGECVEHNSVCYGLVAPLYDMAKVAAQTLLDQEAAFKPVETSTKLKVTGVDVFSAGSFQGGDDSEDIVYRDAARGVYKRLVLKDDKVAGAVLYGDTADGAWYFQLLKDKEPVGDIRDKMIFGQALLSADADPFSAVAGLPDTAEICGCNGVCKGTIVQAIGEHGLTDIDGVKKFTKASASCGSCSGLVEQVLGLTLGDTYSGENQTKPMCGCTQHAHDDVRRLIIAKSLKNIPEVMQALEWTTPDGCSSCRPALNYYLLCAWPGEYVDDSQSRFVNERHHANIQKDGTFSVVPRMWGGLTNPNELRAIADVADKYEIPTVKVTGGQRIDLLGAKKEDLPSIWSELNDAGLVSGHAYGKALRTVKTCVGSEWCRFGTQDSTGMGVKLEQLTWGSWMPHKFKMAVSGCPRNCAESTIKDFGIIAVDSGWELHVGGNGGMKVRVTDFLCKVETEEEVIEHCFAFIQLYREEARYLERTAPWIERVGLDHVKEKLLDDAENRKALAERFRRSQQHAQDDPWAMQSRDPELRRTYEPLREKVIA
ncbi:nitrite reductase large subunit NirB [Tepidicaulis sp. LMO-SS28]|uniref:nitrite reductase large subunit NirB n=1 Tax=Tepidicaulis sp. LMO-SS28 TaxID=3447455 RepID=UPI003EE2577C